MSVTSQVDRIEAVAKMARRLFGPGRLVGLLIREPPLSLPVVEIEAAGQRLEFATAEELRKRIIAAGIFRDVLIRLDWHAQA